MHTILGFYDDFYDDFGGGYGGGGNQGRFGGRGGSGGRGMSGGMGNRRGGGMGGMGGRGMSNSRDGANYQSQTGHCVHMRGLPFAANEQDILDVSLAKIISYKVWPKIFISRNLILEIFLKKVLLGNYKWHPKTILFWPYLSDNVEKIISHNIIYT